ncbi:MerR family transcriptional regulator [Pseudalkalibacillus decolorationis]|uniref:MerR family transcriptional regulator n=1 Tax=Pseudalkalibacillus decolorationis TaxID=163879 RepID=UPI0021487315|nr:MerR family transcriptional regulator [Pseudalkalibacillus decolorationis]
MIIKKNWKIGELAKQTGLTVRTLHHYDNIGLFSPSQHSSVGHRIYTESDIAELQKIISLKQLGFALEEIKRMIGSPSFRADEVIRMQLDRLNEHIRIQEQLQSRLSDIYDLLSTQQDVTAEQFIKLIEVINMNEYFTKEQIDEIKKRGEQFTQEERKQYEKEWAEITGEFRVEIEKGTSPGNPEVVKLAKRWNELVSKTTGGDPEITKAAEKYYSENPDNALQYGMDGDLYKYIKKASENM